MKIFLLILKNLMFSIAFVMLLIGCVSKKKFAELNTEKKALADSITLLSQEKKTNTYTRQDYLFERSNFISSLIMHRDGNIKLNDKVKTKHSSLVLTSTSVGIVGGGVGIITDKDDIAAKVSGVTSLLSGGVTAIIGTLNLKTDLDLSSHCKERINTKIALIEVLWPENRFPNTNELLSDFRQDKENIYKELNELKCFGTIGVK